eukprot:scaffold70_cov242-Pinguiococcus_pyrenoidosus.AAC.4
MGPRRSIDFVRTAKLPSPRKPCFFASLSYPATQARSSDFRGRGKTVNKGWGSGCSSRASQVGKTDCEKCPSKAEWKGDPRDPAAPAPSTRYALRELETGSPVRGDGHHSLRVGPVRRRLTADSFLCAPEKSTVGSPRLCLPIGG